MISTAIVALVLLYVLWDRRVERREWEKERRLLLTRIQAPQMAPALVHDDGPSPETLHVPLDDDDAWDEHLKEVSPNGGGG